MQRRGVRRLSERVIKSKYWGGRTVKDVGGKRCVWTMELVCGKKLGWIGKLLAREWFLR